MGGEEDFLKLGKQDKNLKAGKEERERGLAGTQTSEVVAMGLE